MKRLRVLSHSFVLCAALFLLTQMLLSPRAHAAADEATVNRWQVQWIDRNGLANEFPPPDGPWLDSGEDRILTEIPAGYVGMWARLSVPPTSAWHSPGLFAERLYGLDISVYEGDRLLYASKRSFMFERNHLLLPLASRDEPTELYLRIVSEKQAGPSRELQVGEFDALSDRFVRQGLPDVLFGAAIAFLGLIMSLCSGYLNARQRGSWAALCLIALTIGTLIVTYSELPYAYFEQYGQLFLCLFDLSFAILFPSLNSYVNRVFDRRYRFYNWFARAQGIYAAFCVAIIALHYLSGGRGFAFYDTVTNTIAGPIVLVQMVLITALAIVHAVKGNRDSMILTGGIFALALSGAADLTLFYASGARYVLFLWKIGVGLLILSLVVILARRIASDYSKLLSHSKELELYNHRLQRTEKMKIISDLAASVAHEVRNPLQVTRGFLQLLARKSENGSSSHFQLAINELDRASTIITDFLTFAKPELEQVVLMNLSEEMGKIETIIHPLASMHGGALEVRIEEGLHIAGNASKFKQAVINIIKNSIEALKADGKIEIRTYAENGTAVVRIADNGEGMEPEQIAMLGEPFFSTKSKGTGLGLMVTFRIIEVMKGTLEFRSEKGKGTEAYVRFPLASPDSVPHRADV